jgi:hypothetical protein
MGLTMNQRKAVTNELAKRYQRATKTERGRLLKEFIQLTGYAHCYASHLLHNWGKRRIRIVNGERVEAVIGVKPTSPKQRKKPRRYDETIITLLEKIWAIADGLCGKRLRAFIHTALPILERFGELHLPDHTVRTKLLTISPATIDRLLAPTRKRFWDKERSSTKPGTLLKHHIPIRTFADWNEHTPGFLEIDLVAHDGGSGYGDFLQTLDATDIATGWTETRALRTKALVWVLKALHNIKRELPFPMLGLDSDNGSEFINGHFLRFCEDSKITFTRSRPFRKNDSCYVEQKNYSIVRKCVGYYRYDNDQQLALLDELYAHLRLYTNYFQPVMKLVSKTRIGSAVRKHYDEPQTPFQRLLIQPSVPLTLKDQLSQEFNRLNPAELKRRLAQLQHTLFLSHSPLPQRPTHTVPAPDHPWRRPDGLRKPKTIVDSHKENRHPPPPP